MRRRTAEESFDDMFDPGFLTAWEAIAAGQRVGLSGRLLADLTRVQHRRTPLRHTEGYGSRGTVRLRFADGTTVLARPAGRGGLGAVALALHRGSAVLLTAFREDGEAARAILSWNRGGRAEVDVIGADQPD